MSVSNVFSMANAQYCPSLPAPIPLGSRHDYTCIVQLLELFTFLYLQAGGVRKMFDL